MMRRLHILFFILLFCTEFYYLEIGIGYARLYHFAAAILFLSLIELFPRLFASPVFIYIFIFSILNIIAAYFSDAPKQAFASLTLYMGNLTVALTTALILVRGKINVVSFKSLVIKITIISIIWGLIQIIVYRLTGHALALSQQQEAQIVSGFGPAFRTEANTFGKFMSLPFLLYLPDYIRNKRTAAMNWTYLLFLVGILMNFTRTSIFGIIIALFFVILRYIHIRKLSRFLIRGFLIAFIVGAGLFVITSGSLNVSEYAIHKIQTLFSEEEILSGGSSAYRLEGMQAVLEKVWSDPKKMIIGNGWGQTHAYIRGYEIQAGGGDSINILGYAGFTGVIAYFAFMLAAFFCAKKAAKFKDNEKRAQFAEGIMFALIGMFFTAQMSGYLNSPEFWMLIGICIYLGLKPRIPRPAAVQL